MFGDLLYSRQFIRYQNMSFEDVFHFQIILCSMSFFKHVKLHEYDITDSGITSACYDELVADGNNSDPKQLEILARAMCEEFKDYMRPLFA